MANEEVNRRFTTDQAAFPTKGPSNQPAAPHAIVAIPSTTNGSRPITCAPIDSISCVERYCTPSTVVPADVTTDETTEYRRRAARSLKNVFQSSRTSPAAAGFELAVVEFARSVTSAGVLTACGPGRCVHCSPVVVFVVGLIRLIRLIPATVCFCIDLIVDMPSTGRLALRISIFADWIAGMEVERAR